MTSSFAAFSASRLRFSLVLASLAIAACSSAPVVTGSSGEGSGEGTSSSSGETSSNGGATLGTPVSSSSGETSSNGGTSSGESSGSSGTSGASSSGTSSSGTSGTSTAPRAECVAWANRHCTCLEKASAAAPNCRTKSAQGCEDGVKLCPKQLSWYTCSQTTCGNTCPNPGC